MGPREKLIAMVLACAMLGAATFAQTRADATRARTETELLYLPNEKLLTHFTAGMSSIVADMLWLRCVQYVGSEAQGARNFKWLGQMISMVTELDPYFVDVYRYGGLFLATLKAQDDAGLELLHRGFVRNPHAWELPYECAMVYLLNRRDWPNARQMATRYLAISAKTGRAPQAVIDLAAKLAGQHNLVEVEFEMWSEMLKSDDKLLRELAEQKLLEMKQRLQKQPAQAMP